MYVNSLTKSKIQCPIVKCKQIWPFDIIVAAADLDENEAKILGKTLSMYKIENEKNVSNNINNAQDVDIVMTNVMKHEIENENKQKDNQNDTYDMNFSQYCEINKGNSFGLNNLNNTCFMNSALQVRVYMFIISIFMFFVWYSRIATIIFGGRSYCFSLFFSHDGQSV